MDRAPERSPVRLITTVFAFIGWAGIVLFLPQFWQLFWTRLGTMQHSLASQLFLVIGGGTLLSAIIAIPVLAMCLPIFWWLKLETESLAG
ncbi:hypothetical protein [Haladaptatus sp. NG-SE-30]